MAKRFKKIRGMIKMAKKFGVDITTDDNIKAYLDYRDGTSTSATKPKAVARGGSKIATLLPFYTRRFTADFRHAVKVSGRASTEVVTLGAEAELGIDLGTTVLTTQATGKVVKGFLPAKAIVKTGAATAATSKKSGITLLDYKSYGGTSYTLPFGAINTAGKKTYVEQVGNLTKTLAVGNNTVSFKQEKPGFA